MTQCVDNEMQRIYNALTASCNILNSLDGPLIGTVHIVVVQCSTFLFISLFCISGQSLESLGTTPVTFDSLLILSEQLTMKYTV